MELRKIRYFTLSFAAAFLVLSMMAAACAFWIRPYEPRTEPLSAGEGLYLPREKDGLTFFLMGTQGPGQPLEQGTLLRFAPEKGQVPILTLPGELKLRTQAGPLRLRDIYEQQGPARTAELLACELEIPIDRYGVITPETVQALAGEMGGLEYTVPHSIFYMRGDVRLEIAQGPQRLDGLQLRELIRAWNGEEGLTVCQEFSGLTAAAVRQYFQWGGTQRGEALFRETVNRMETDLDYLDYESRRKAFRFMAELEKDPAVICAAEGQYDVTGQWFLPAPACREQIRCLFAGPDNTKKLQETS